ncbi:MAG: HEAT repeat domain-containing protein, partial [Polyangiaceae bacterium]
AFPMLLQRFTFLTKPDSESLSVVSNIYGRASLGGEVAITHAAAYALGAMAGADTRAGNAAGAEPYVARLRADLEQTKAPAEKRELLIAIGNARRDADTAFVTKYASDAAPEARIGAARALGGSTSREARPTLLKLAADGDARVQAAAIASLAPEALEASDVHALAMTVTGGQTSPANDGDLVTLIGNHPEPHEDTRAMLDFLMHRAKDPRARARIEFVLSQLPPK